MLRRFRLDRFLEKKMKNVDHFFCEDNGGNGAKERQGEKEHDQLPGARAEGQRAAALQPAQVKLAAVINAGGVNSDAQNYCAGDEHDRQGPCRSEAAGAVQT